MGYGAYLLLLLGLSVPSADIWNSYKSHQLLFLSSWTSYCQCCRFLLTWYLHFSSRSNEALQGNVPHHSRQMRTVLWPKSLPLLSLPQKNHHLLFLRRKDLERTGPQNPHQAVLYLQRFADWLWTKMQGRPCYRELLGWDTRYSHFYIHLRNRNYL